MAIPAVGLFEEFLAAARVVTERPTTRASDLVHESTASPHGQGLRFWLEYPPSELQSESVLKKVAEALATAGTPSTRSVAQSVLALIVATKGADGHIEHANRLLGELRRGDLLFNFVSPGPPPAVDVRADYGPVKVEPFNPTRLEYWAARGGAQWPVAPKDIRGRVAVVGQVRGATLLNTDALPGADRLARQGVDTGKGLVDAYFQSAADALLDDVRADITQRLSLVEAAGMSAFDFSSVTNWSLGLHLFTWSTSGASRAGCWALYRQPGIVLNTPPGAIWCDAQKWLLEEFGLDSISGDRPIDIAAQTFARLMQDARAHLSDARTREAFLYFVIALDHLLGEDGNNTATVADRTSVLTHSMRSRTFADEVTSVRRVYDARSRLVHSGTPVTDEDLREADAMARGVLWALTRVVADRELETRDEWARTIDSLAYLFRGDPTVVTSERLATVGAVPSFRAGPPPPMLRDRTATSERSST